VVDANDGTLVTGSEASDCANLDVSQLVVVDTLNVNGAKGNFINDDYICACNSTIGTSISE
jgi:hypothetical protein